MVTPYAPVSLLQRARILALSSMNLLSVVVFRSNMLFYGRLRYGARIFGPETWLSLLRELGFEVNQMELRPSSMQGEDYLLLVRMKPH